MFQLFSVLTLILNLAESQSCIPVPQSSCTPSGLVTTISFNIYYFPPTVAAPLFMPLWLATFTRSQMITGLVVEYKRPQDTEWSSCFFDWIWTPYFKDQTAQFAPWIDLNPHAKGNYDANFLLIDINATVQDCHHFSFSF